MAGDTAASQDQLHTDSAGRGRADHRSGPADVTFSSAGTTDPDRDPITHEWDFDMDGTVDSTEPNPTFTDEQNGVFDATLKVTDSTGHSAAASVPSSSATRHRSWSSPPRRRLESPSSSTSRSPTRSR
jgi:hypothetical protein